MAQGRLTPIDDETAEKIMLLATRTHINDIAQQLGFSKAKMSNWTARRKIKALSYTAAKTPPFELWHAAAHAEAQEARLPVAALLGPGNHKRYSRPRWRAWKRLLDGHPQYSIAGLARCTGWDHSSIIYGLRKLRHLEAQNGQMVNNPPRAGIRQVQGIAPPPELGA